MSVGFAYGLTRLHARIAERPGPDTRKRLAAVNDFGHFLQLAARSGFGGWLTNLGPGSGVHAVELVLREAYRGSVHEIASWLPAPWRTVVEWLTLAPDLPVLSDLLLHGRRADWMARDPVWAELPDGPGEPVRQALQQRWPALADYENDELGEAWWAQADALLPRMSRPTRNQVDKLLRAQIEPAEPAWLERTFRRASEPAVRVFAFAGLARRDFGFMRGHLVRRRLQWQEAA
ncbi:MAG: hypothetical protein ACNS61_11020 [Candidatus Wenzhouxiangella sp. M2_3B_020]